MTRDSLITFFGTRATGLLKSVKRGLKGTSLRSQPPARQRGSGELALIAGWFSSEECSSTFGDTEALRVVAGWLDERAIPYDIACSPANGFDGLDIDRLDPSPYTLFIFVCGPWLPDVRRFLDRFSHCRKIGVNLSLESARDHGFDAVLPRDMPGHTAPDIVFASPVPSLPLAGIALVHPQPEYRHRQRHHLVGSVVDQYLSRHEIAAVPLDTHYSLDRKRIGNALDFENLIGRTDLVITTRLHGMVFALKRGVPALVIDPVAGGAKVTAQAKAIGWPIVLPGETLDENALRNAVRHCLDPATRVLARRTAAGANAEIAKIKEDFLKLAAGERPNRSGMRQP